MAIRFTWCRSDADYARYVLYYIRNRHLFSERMNLLDTLFHVLTSLQETRILLILSEDDLIGWGQFGIVGESYRPDPEGTIMFMHSTVVDPAFRSNGLFLRGFRELIDSVAGETPQIREFHFFAQRDNAYLNRLYGKFARVIGQREGLHGEENIFATGMDELKRYLRLA
ncbi:GNAT family N-acetyltransferase [Paenibacillus sp. 1P07SE]|uniref:GNAT family N-acetyltransferase n=1 Tax=Paenibacillus sp. 1P07SE TaxID=3132209 RepID=UPI0039A579C5